MKSFRVLCASVNPSTGFIEVVKELTADDNTTSLNLHTFHPETLEWKAAELDLSDLDEIIDGILHEPFFEDVQALQLSKEDAKTLFRTRLTEAKARLTSPIPRNAIAIRTLLGNAGVAQRYIDAVNGDPIQAIKAACPFSAEVIAVKRGHTDKVRAVALNEKAAKVQAPPTSSERVARLKDQLRTQVDSSGRRPEVPVQEVSLPPIILGERRGRTRTDTEK